MSVITNSKQNHLIKPHCEWPTIALFALTYGGWLILTAFHAQIPLFIVLLLLTLLVTLHSSLQHEVIHGHPTQWPIINTALAFPSPGLLIAYRRYELLHLEHHRNWLITDPFDDSESYFMSQPNWLKLKATTQRILNFNNCLVGRLTIGPAIMIVRWLPTEFALSKTCAETRNSWLLHLCGTTSIILFLMLVNFPLWLYFIAVAYPALSMLSLRSFSEHLPEENIEVRSAIIKTNWVMQLLYLNNNYHRVHHDYPWVAWYRLPELYRREYKHHTTHVYNGYSELFRRYAFKQRYSVAHPFLARD